MYIQVISITNMAKTLILKIWITIDNAIRIDTCKFKYYQAIHNNHEKDNKFNIRFVDRRDRASSSEQYVYH